jgi:hypothetical protein
MAKTRMDLPASVGKLLKNAPRDDSDPPAGRRQKTLVRQAGWVPPHGHGVSSAWPSLDTQSCAVELVLFAVRRGIVT